MAEDVPPSPTTRRAYFPEAGPIEVELHDRRALRVGEIVCGPCLVGEPTTTTVVLGGDTVEVAPDGALVIDVAAA